MKRFIIWLVAIALFTTACKKDKGPIDIDPDHFSQKSITSQNVVLNPSGFAPLTASIHLETNINTRARLRVVGKNGPASDVVHDFTGVSNSYDLPVLGLYGNYDNTVELTLYDDQNKDLGTSSIIIPTDSLLADLPAITIDVPAAATQPLQMTLVSYYGYATEKLPQRPFIFDDFGDIRWYLDLRTNQPLSQLSMEDGIEVLRNRNFYLGDISSNAIYEIDMFGNILNTWSLANSDFTFHHQVTEKPDGNFIMTVTKPDLETTDDHVIEISRASSAVVKVWDLRQSLQYDRTTWTDNREDWLHLNAVEYDSADNTIIASGRTQGLVKLDQDNNVKWIMAPHRGWGIAGNGVDLTTKLLTPLDAQGNEITDPAVLDGSANHPDFEWNWYEHAPAILPDRSLMMFDNGDSRNYGTEPTYSRAVRYKLDEQAMTVQQLWQYGKERGLETYAGFVSDVDFNPSSGNVVFSPGAINSDGPRHGKIIEIKENTSQVQFEATLVPPQTNGVTMHRSERVNLYR